MGLAEPAQKVLPGSPVPIDMNELEYIAFSGQHETAHGIFRSIPHEYRSLYASKYILSEVITGGIKKLRTYLAASAEESAADEKVFIDEVVKLFIAKSLDTQTSSRELFKSILDWSDELTRLSLLQEGLHYYDELLALGIKKYPDLHIRSLIAKAAVLNTLGSFRDAQSILRSLSTRPYIIPDRNLISDVLFDLAKESLLKGESLLYKQLLFQGLRHFYTRIENRKRFIEQIAKTYRRSYKVGLDSEISLLDKILFFIHRIFFAMADIRLFTMLRLTSVIRLLILGSVYAINYGVRFPRMKTPNTAHQGEPA